MTERLFIHAFDGSQGTEFLWAVLAVQGGRIKAEGTGLPSIETGPFASIVLVIDGRRVLVRRESLPARSDTQARKTAPYVLEDHLATAPDDAHVAVGPLDDGATRLLAVADSDWLTKLLDRLASAGLDPDAVYADHLLFAAQHPDKAAAAATEDVVFACRPGGTAVKVDADLAATILPSFFSAARRPNPGRHAEEPGHSPFHPATVHLMGAAPDLTRALESADLVVDASRLPAHASGFALWHQAITDGQALNLRQGAFAKKADWSPIIRTWSRVAALAVLVGASVMLSLFAEARSLYARADAIDKSALAQMQSVYPDVRGINHMEARVADLRASASDRFLVESAILFDAIQSVDGIVLVSVRFDEARAAMTASLNAGSFQDVARLRDAVRARGARLEEGTSRQTGGRILADVRLTVGGVR